MAAANDADRQPGRPGTQRDAHGKPIKIAVVDDDREMRTWLAAVLGKAGFRVMQATNGLRLVSTLQVDRPHLILLDVVNSWIDGFELCRALKQNPQFRDIPLVFISGRSAPSDIERGLACGAVDYFPKPVDSRKLIARIRHLVALRDGSLPPA